MQNPTLSAKHFTPPHHHTSTPHTNTRIIVIPLQLSCYTRFMDNWRAAMVGWSRINDLALQVFAYVRDRGQACEIIRLMNAANHLCYGELAGQDMFGLCMQVSRCNRMEHQQLERVQLAS